MRKWYYFLHGRLFSCALLALLTAGAGIFLTLWLPTLLAPLAIVERLFALSVGLYLFALPTLNENKLSGNLLLLFLPWTGAIFCLLLYRKQPLQQKRAPLAFSQAQSVEYFADGALFYPKFLHDLSLAKQTIWLEYYIVAKGKFWEEILKILTQKAKEGVDVRLIYDDFGSSLTLPRKYETALMKEGIKAFPFRPLHFFSRSLTLRNHQKIAVIDREIAYTGGLNLADEYVGQKVRFGHWKDTAVRVTGVPALDFARLFAHVWNRHAPTVYERITDMPPVKQKTEKTDETACALFYDEATTSLPRVGDDVFCTLFERANETLYLCTPYLALDSRLMRTLENCALRGVDVRLMIPHIPDKRAVFFLSRSYARELQKFGVKVREYTEGFLHAKSVTVDGNACVISSYNLDFRSLYLQAECGLFLKDAHVTQEVEQDFLAIWKKGTPLKKANRAEEIFSRLMRVFAPTI